MTAILPLWVYEFHPHDWFFLFPVAASAVCFSVGGKLPFVPATLIAAGLSMGASITALVIELGRPWALIGMTAAMIFLLYIPICAAVGLVLRLLQKAHRSKDNYASDQ